MKTEVKIYPSDKYIYVCELWGASTKHPDCIYHYTDFHKVDWLEDEYQIFQWLLEIASKQEFPFHAKQIAEYALQNWVNWN